MSAHDEEVVPAPADDFEQEVESLGRNQEFQRFLDRRAASGGRIALSDFEAEIERSIATIDIASHQEPEKGDIV